MASCIWPRRNKRCFTSLLNCQLEICCWRHCVPKLHLNNLKSARGASTRNQRSGKTLSRLTGLSWNRAYTQALLMIPITTPSGSGRRPAPVSYTPVGTRCCRCTLDGSCGSDIPTPSSPASSSGESDGPTYSIVLSCVYTMLHQP